MPIRAFEPDHFQDLVKEFQSLMKARLAQTETKLEDAEMAAEVALLCGAIACQGLLSSTRQWNLTTLQDASHGELVLTAQFQRMRGSVLNALVGAVDVQLANEYGILKAMATTKGPMQ